MIAKYYIGDVYNKLKLLPDNSVDLVLTSPPFLALRAYLPEEHPLKDLEIGTEGSPAEFLSALLLLVSEIDRVLAPHGSLCIELGDTYSGSGGAGGDFSSDGLRGNRAEQSTTIGARKKSEINEDWPLDKSLCIIPELFAACLSYGRNVLTGEASPAGYWRVRNMVRWCKPNPMPGALSDKFRPATSVMTVACKNNSRWFDLESVLKPNPRSGELYKVGKRAKGVKQGSGGDTDENRIIVQNPKGSPPFDWWKISKTRYRGSHYATWPESFCEIPIKSMCPHRVCITCGVPQSRIKKSEEWTDCGHNNWRKGVVLDPFAGSGTTLAVAIANGRSAIGIDIDERNSLLAQERVGMFLEIVN